MNEFEFLFENYKLFGLDDLRNAFSEELIKTSLILKSFLNVYGEEIYNLPYNYVNDKDTNLTEDELLNVYYKDIYILKTELLLLGKYINKGDN